MTANAPSQAPAQELNLQPHSMLAFATPVIAYPWPDSDDLNARLRESVLAAEARDKGMKRSNVGGWHSTTDFFEWDDPAIHALAIRVRDMTMSLTRSTALLKDGARSFSYRISGWANVSRDGHYNTVHNHPNCLWSGTYYVSPGEPDPDSPTNGKLELLDPRLGANMIHLEDTILQQRVMITPIPGLMVVFPSWLNHLVHPFRGRGERISIAFNIQTTEVRKPAPAG